MRLKYIFLLTLSLFSNISEAAVSCKAMTRELVYQMTRDGLLISELYLAERLINISVEDVDSTAELNKLLKQASAVNKYLTRKSLLMEKTTSIFFNINKKCPNFDEFFNELYMEKVIDIEFDKFLLSTENLAFKKSYLYKRAFKASELKETAYFKFKNFTDVFEFLESSVNNIFHNEELFKEIISKKQNERNDQITSEQLQINLLREKIKKEQEAAEKLQKLKEEKVKLQKQLEKQIEIISSDGSLLTERASDSIMFTDVELCKAAINAEFFAPLDTIRTNVLSNSVINVFYNRVSDGKFWSHNCTVKNGLIIWSSPGGRWRNNYQWDTKISYEIFELKKQLILNLEHSDGSSERKLYNLNDIKVLNN